MLIGFIHNDALRMCWYPSYVSGQNNGEEYGQGLNRYFKGMIEGGVVFQMVQQQNQPCVRYAGFCTIMRNYAKCSKCSKNIKMQNIKMFKSQIGYGYGGFVLFEYI